MVVLYGDGPMTLVCECGGVLTIVNQSYSEDRAYEQFECENCGRTGSMTHNGKTTTLTGCVTRK